jgi:hypothetical protein
MTQHPATGIDQARWHKARASSGTGGCVEVAELPGGLVAVRDSKDISRPPHLYPRSAWTAFTALLDELGAVPLTTDRIRIDVTGDAVVLHDLHGGVRPHVFTAFEWDCFLDGVRNREPELAGL